MRASTRPGRRCQGSGRQEEPAWTRRTIRRHICAISPTSASCSSLSAQLIFSTRSPETRALFKGGGASIKDSFQIQGFRPFRMSHRPAESRLLARRRFYLLFAWTTCGGGLHGRSRTPLMAVQTCDIYRMASFTQARLQRFAFQTTKRSQMIL